MYIYKNIPLYDQYSGEKSGFKLKKTGTLCDYTGELIKDLDEFSSFKIEFDYSNGCEYAWEEDNIDVLMEVFPDGDWDSFNIKRIIAGQKFIYKVDNNYISYSTYLIKDWVDGCRSNDLSNKFYNCKDIAEATRIQRLHLITQLLKDKTYTVEELGLTQEQ